MQMSSMPVRAVGSKSNCPVFVANDLSGFVVCGLTAVEPVETVRNAAAFCKDVWENWFSFFHTAVSFHQAAPVFLFWFFFFLPRRS
jgi:hypothetical protein